LNSYRLALLVSAALLTSGCAHFQSNTTLHEDATTTEQQSSAEEIEYGDFSLEQDTLHDLLVAEIASQRSQFDITLVNYIHQAQATRDPAIILRAINAAQIAKDNEAIKQLAMLWLEDAPDNISAHQLLVYQYSIEQSYEAAFEHTAKILELGGLTNAEALAISSSDVSDEDKTRLLNLYQNLFEQFPQHWELQYSIALVQRYLRQCDEAIANLDQVMAIQPEFQQAAIVKANCLNESGRKQEALEYSAEAFDDFPNNNALGRLYASLLIDQNRTEDAEQVFAELLEYYPDSPTLTLSYGLLLLENGKTTESKQAFLSLEKSKSHANDAHYYLGRIAEQEEDTQEAIRRYRLVTPSTHFNNAVERLVYLMATTEDLDSALEYLAQLRSEQINNADKLWIVEYQLLNTLDKRDRALESLNSAIEASPSNEQLLYARAMHFDGDNNIAGMEADLSAILESDPNNAIALNALGYTLADRTDRLQEALQLITRALALKPNNPAIMDSMGWVLFKLGETEKSLQLLGAAYLNYPDGEVAAHLGEVLWSTGKEKEARQVWNNSLRQQPNHKVLRATLERLAPDLLAPAKPTTEDTPDDATTQRAEENTKADDEAEASNEQ